MASLLPGCLQRLGILVQLLLSSCLSYIFAGIPVSLTATTCTTSGFATPVSCMGVLLAAEQMLVPAAAPKALAAASADETVR